MGNAAGLRVGSKPQPHPFMANHSLRLSVDPPSAIYRAIAVPSLPHPYLATHTPSPPLPSPSSSPLTLSQDEEQQLLNESNARKKRKEEVTRVMWDGNIATATAARQAALQKQMNTPRTAQRTGPISNIGPQVPGRGGPPRGGAQQQSLPPLPPGNPPPPPPPPDDEEEEEGDVPPPPPPTMPPPLPR